MMRMMGRGDLRDYSIGMFGGWPSRRHDYFDTEMEGPSKTQKQRSWVPPEMVEPDPVDEVVTEKGMQNRGMLENDAALYALKEMVSNNLCSKLKNNRDCELLHERFWKSLLGF